MNLVDLWRRAARALVACVPSARPRQTSHATGEQSQLTSLPWPPQDILKDRVFYMAQIVARPPRAIKGTDQDTPLHCLYRVYEHLVLDDTIGYRNEIEYFWRRRGWPVAGIPDPQDSDPARYAFLAGIPQLLVQAFNNNVRIGLARYTPAIISPEEAEVLQNTPEEEKIYERVPEWTFRVKPLEEVLTIPIVAGPDLVLPTEEELEPVFWKMNIKLGTPHILFT